MKTNKKLIICALLLITMISIVGAVSASESSNDTLATADTANDAASIDDSQSLSESTTTTSSSNNDNTETPDSETQNIDKTITPTVGNANDQTTVKAKRKVNTTNIENFFNATTGHLTNNVAEGDELEFEGEVKNRTFTINKTITLTGKNALMNNTAFIIAANNVKISNFTFVADKIFDSNAVIYSYANDTIIEKNNITYTAPNTGDSYVILLEGANRTQIIGNIIDYIGQVGDDIKTVALYAQNTTDLTIKNNDINATIPSKRLTWTWGWDEETFEFFMYAIPDSAGISIDVCPNLKIENNNITVQYNGIKGSDDTIYAIGIHEANNSNVNKNNVEIKGHTRAYGLVIDSALNAKTDVSENNIIAYSDDLQANAVDIGGTTNVTVNNNNITAIATNLTYPIAINDMNHVSETKVINNNITGTSNIVYGIYIEQNKTTIENNNITAIGNYPIGIVSHTSDSKITDNTINVTGTNTGSSSGSQSSVPVETVGICASNANLEIINNNITSTGNYTIDAIKIKGTIKDNNLTANTTTGDKTVKNQDSTLKDIVTPETFKDFFDDEGYIKTINNYLTFIGLFDGANDNIGLKEITLNKPITIIGNNAILKNIALTILSDNVTISNITFRADKNLNDLIYIFGENTIFKNNTIIYNAPSTADSYAILFESADGSQLIGNKINYTGKLNSTNATKTIAIYSTYTNNLTIKDNTINATIPSVDVDYSEYPLVTILSTGILLDNSGDITLENNNITVKYNEANGYYDTIYAINANGDHNAKIAGNNIEILGNMYAYGLATKDFENVEITNNNIKTIAEADQSNALELTGNSTFNIEGNNITSIAKDIVYPIHLSNFDKTSTAIINKNNITGNADVVYGIYTQGHDNTISNNNITANGKYVTGIMTHKSDAAITNNNINSNGTNTGSAKYFQGGAPENETVGICSSLGSIEVTNNNITSTGNYTIHIMDTDGTIKDNNLTANGTTGAKTVKNEGSIITDIVTPANIGEFFDNNGMLIETVSNKLIFQGLFNGTKYHINPKAITLNKPMTIIGDNAIFQNLGLNILEDNVTVSNITFIADTNLNELIYILGANTIFKNNTIIYNAPNTADTYAIYLESADGSQIIGNKINYTGKLNSTGTLKTIPIYSEYSANILLKDNTINATIPASMVGWSQDPVTGNWFPNIFLSSGIITKNSANSTIQNNNITIKYNETDGSGYDTIYAININGNGTAKLTGNNIKITGHAYTYGIATTDFKNVEITNNNIKTIAEADQSNALELTGNSTFNIKGNNITSIAKDIVYPINLSNTDKATSDVTINQNNINGEADVVYGIYTEGHDNTISNNNITANGKYTTGIMNHKSNATIIKNNINSNGTNTGSAKYFQGGAPENETLAICSSLSTVEIINNNLTSTGNYTLNATKCKVILGTESETFNLLNEDIVLKEIAADKTQISNLTEQVGTLTNQTENLTKQVGTLTDENKKLTTEKDDANKALAAKNTEAANLQTQVGSLTAENKQLNSDLKTANNKVSNSNASIKKVKAASSVKKSKNFKVTVTLNKKVKGKYVYVAFNGNTYRAKTNSKGVATITIKSKVIKKLAGKKVKYQVMFGQKMYKKSVKVKK